MKLNAIFAVSEINHLMKIVRILMIGINKSN